MQFIGQCLCLYSKGAFYSTLATFSWNKDKIMSVLNPRDAYGESNILAFIKEILSEINCSSYALPVGVPM